jgi:hypothetical protein
MPPTTEDDFTTHPKCFRNRSSNAELRLTSPWRRRKDSSDGRPGSWGSEKWDMHCAYIGSRISNATSERVLVESLEASRFKEIGALTSSPISLVLFRLPSTTLQQERPHSLHRFGWREGHDVLQRRDAPWRHRRVQIRLQVKEAPQLFDAFTHGAEGVHELFRSLRARAPASEMPRHGSRPAPACRPAGRATIRRDRLRG